MRELKFRAWFDGYDGELEPSFYDSDSLFDDTWIPVRPYCVEQYTGLKDKNGKEIYEGDILRLYGRFISQITWRETPVAFSWFANDGDGNCGLSKENEEYYEVIGNIHENPELLEAE